MKKQMSPQAFIEDLKRDWPRWRAVMPKLLDRLERSAHDSSTETSKLIEELRIQATLKSKRRFHQNLGFGAAITGLVLTVLAQNSFIASTSIATLAPWVGIAGLIWALYRSR